MPDETIAAGSAPSTPAAPIKPEDDILRRILPDWIVDDEKHPGRRRLSSVAFRPLPHSPCSGYVAKECTHSDVLGIYNWCAIGAVRTADLLHNNYKIERDVAPGEHASHVHLIQPSGLSKSKQRDLWTEVAKATRWIAGERWGDQGSG